MDDEAKQRRLANLRPFKPGQSGNPGGRSKAQIDVRNLAREHTKEAIETLVLVMRNSNPHEWWWSEFVDKGVNYKHLNSDR